MGQSDKPLRLVVGCMTGTSIDGLDCSLVRIEGHGVGLRATVLRNCSTELGELRHALRSLAEGEPATAAQISQIALEFSTLHAKAIVKVAGADKIDLACVHGQTVFHKPPLSWQLINPWPIVRAANAPVVFDLRGADLASGGQGAPITPIADAILLRHHPELAFGFSVVNLGGFANATVVPALSANGVAAGLDGVRGFDICACNQLLDRIARDVLHVPFDEDGRIASSGTVHERECGSLFELLQKQSGDRRSLGTGDEAFAWVAGVRETLKATDIAATACEAIGRAVFARCRGTPAILLAGGGAKNQALKKAISTAAGCTAVVAPIDRFGIPGEYRESIEFAVLGALCQDKVPITLPKVTGVTAPAPLSGAWAFPS